MKAAFIPINSVSSSQALKLFAGDFEAEEAKQQLLQLLNDHRRRESQRRFSQVERFGSESVFNSGVSQSDCAQLEVLDLIQLAHDHGLKVNIDANITLTLVHND